MQGKAGDTSVRVLAARPVLSCVPGKEAPAGGTWCGAAPWLPQGPAGESFSSVRRELLLLGPYETKAGPTTAGRNLSHSASDPRGSQGCAAGDGSAWLPFAKVPQGLIVSECGISTCWELPARQCSSLQAVNLPCLPAWEGIIKYWLFSAHSCPPDVQQPTLPALNSKAEAPAPEQILAGWMEVRGQVSWWMQEWERALKHIGLGVLILMRKEIEQLRSF